MRKFILRNKLVIVVCILILAFGLGWWIWAAVPTQTTIGDDIIVSGNIGIGTTSPSAKLHVGDVSGSTIGFIVDSRMKTDGSEAGLWNEIIQDQQEEIEKLKKQFSQPNKHCSSTSDVDEEVLDQQIIRF